MTPRWQLVILGVLSTVMHFASLSLSGMNRCSSFNKCISSNSTDDIQTDTHYRRVSVCFDSLFCLCTGNSAMCALRFYAIDFGKYLLSICFYIWLIFFVCSNSMQRRTYIIEHNTFRFWKRKMLRLFIASC